MLQPLPDGWFRLVEKVDRDLDVLSSIGKLSDETQRCLQEALASIEAGRTPIRRFWFKPNLFVAGVCGFWIHVSVKPEEDRARFVGLFEVRR